MHFHILEYLRVREGTLGPGPHFKFFHIKLIRANEVFVSTNY